MVRAAVLVSGGGTNLQAIIDAKRTGKIPSAELALVVASNASAYALTRAENAGIAHAVLRKEKGEAPADYGERLLTLLRENAIDVVVLAGFLTILPENVIRAYDHRILNIHPSLIPSFCGDGFYGLHVHEAALKRGVPAERIEAGLRRYADYVTRAQVEDRYVMQAATFFRGARWDDEYSTTAPRQQSQRAQRANPALNYKQRTYTADQLRAMGVDFGDDMYDD